MAVITAKSRGNFVPSPARVGRKPRGARNSSFASLVKIGYRLRGCSVVETICWKGIPYSFFGIVSSEAVGEAIQ